MAAIAQRIGSPPTRVCPRFTDPSGPPVERNLPELGTKRGSSTLLIHHYQKGVYRSPGTGTITLAGLDSKFSEENIERGTRVTTKNNLVLE